MEKLTNTLRSMYQECPKKFYYRNELGYLPVREAEALSFGKAFHTLLEYWFRDVIDLPVMVENADPFTAVKIEELFRGYCAKWPRVKADAVECEYVLPLLNPATTAPSRTFELAGKIDAIVSGDVVEHKTTSDSIEDPACEYWQRLSLDSQISGYFLAAEKLGYKPSKIIYDVIKKPTIRPAKATPEEVRKYKKDGTLYANQRATDETPEEFRQRLREDITANPDKYFQRREIARLENDLVEYMQDVWSVAKLIMESRAEGYWPKRISQCFSYGRCPYYEVCAKIASLDDSSMYVKAESKNPELTENFNGTF